MNGKVVIGERDAGGGFPVAARVVVTAGHVVGAREASELRFVPDVGAPGIEVVSVLRAVDLDVAVLELAADVPTVFVAGVAVESERFIIDAGPLPSDPRLTGVISAVGRMVELRGGSRAPVLQLDVDQPLGDYGGYSGCAATTPHGRAVGVVVEQVQERQQTPGRRRAAPLLYAIPIEKALERLAADIPVEPARRTTDDLVRIALAPPGSEPDFVARSTELDVLADAWRSGTATVLLHGLPGAGKSALAAHASAIAESEFPDGVLYLDMRGLDDVTTSADRALDQLLDALGVPAQPRPQNADQKSRLLQAATEGWRLLLVLDDIRDEQHARGLILRQTGCATLLTSRSQLPALDDVRRIEVLAFDVDDGVRLLERLVGAERIAAEPEQARRLVGLCGGLPLALRITGGRLATRPGWSVEHYANRLTDERRRLEQLQLGDLDVRASFELSYALQDEAGKRAFRHLGIFPAAAIAPETAGAALGSEGWDDFEALVDGGLLTLHEQRYEIHELLRLYARELLAPGERHEALGRLGEYYITEMHQNAVALQTGTGARALLWAASERAVVDSLPSELTGADRHDLAASLALAVGPLYGPLHAWSAWDRILDVGIEAAERARDAEAVLKLRLNRSIAAVKLGDERRAQEELEIVLNDARTVGDVGVEARALAQLGQIAKSDGRIDTSIAWLERSVDAYRRAGEPHGEAQALGDLANSLDAGGRHEEALDRHVQTAARFDELGDHYAQGLELGNAGFALQQMGRHAEAVESHRASLESFEQIGAAVGAAVAKRRLAEATWSTGDADEAEQLFAAAIETLEAASAWQELAEAFSAREACRVAAGRLEEALGDARRAAGHFAQSGDRRSEALELSRIGLLRGELGEGAGAGDFARAEQLFAAAGDRPSGPRAEGLAQQALDSLTRGDLVAACDLWLRSADMYATVGLGWLGALSLHLAAPMMEESGDPERAKALRDRMIDALEQAESEGLPPRWPTITVVGASSRLARADVVLWVAQAAESAEADGPFQVSVVAEQQLPPGVTRSVNEHEIRLLSDTPAGPGVHEHLREGWHFYAMVGSQEVMRLGVPADDGVGTFLIEAAGEWLAARQFVADDGKPMFRSQPEPVRKRDVVALGAAVGAAATGSQVQRAEVTRWSQRHRRARYATLATELLDALADVDSPRTALQCVADAYVAP